nr:hypothetical protein [Tanacetum cinerariifolium]
MEKIFDVMGCEDAFKTRLAVYKFEGNALAWWKAYKQAKGSDAWLITERLKREYHSIRQTNTETSTEFMQCFLRLAGFLGAAAGTEKEQEKNFQWGLCRSTLNHLMCGGCGIVVVVTAKVVAVDVGSGAPDYDDVRSIVRVVIGGTKEVS